MAELIAGKYEVLETIGRGGMGTVYKAHQRNLDRVVAIKMLSEELAADPEFRARFQQEATIIARLNHPNIVAVHDIEPHNHTFCIIMEYLEGETLQAKIDRDVSLPERDALSIAAQVARALHYAHEHGIIHRDIKPDNIHIAPNGVAKVMDFGIARFLQSKLKTQTGISMGTPKFMSPEQVTGKNVDGQTDLYSLGICLYASLAGRVPFDGENAIAVATRHLYEPPEPPSRINPAITPGAEKVVLKALEKSKADRYRDGAEMAAAIDAVLQTRSSVRLGDETGRELYSGATQKLAAVTAAVAARAAGAGTESSTPEGSGIAVRTPTGLHRLEDVAAREHQAAREQVRASTISTTGVPQLEEEDFPAASDEQTPANPTQQIAHISRLFWPGAVALLLMLAGGAYIIFGGRTEIPLPGNPGAPAVVTPDELFRNVREQAALEENQGRVEEALRIWEEFQKKHRTVQPQQVDREIDRLTARLPLSAAARLAEYRANRGSRFVVASPPALAVGMAYFEAGKQLNNGKVAGPGLNNTNYNSAKLRSREPSNPAAARQSLEEAKSAPDAAAREQALLRAVTLDEKNAATWLELGRFYAGQGLRDDARVILDQAASLEGPAAEEARAERQKLDS